MEMLGAPHPINIDEVEYLRPMIEDFIKNNQNGDDWIYVDKIISATSQVVAGTLYRIEFVAVKTDRSKNDPTKSKENCIVKDKQNCSVAIWEKLWENFVQVTSMNCMDIDFKP